MSTAAYIATALPNGTFRVVYSNFDNYPERTGRLLQTAYNSQAAVNALLDMGNISSLEASLEASKFYTRDYRRNNEDAVLLSRKALFTNDGDVDYAYVFENGQWSAYGTLRATGTFTPISIPA